MPSTITHEYFYRDIYKYTSRKFKNTYEEGFYRKYSVYAQGHDALYFISLHELPKKKTRDNLAHILQMEHFQDFVVTYIHLLHTYNLENSKEAKLILYGYILHHILDSHVHPYIISISENITKHQMIETYVDKYMINKREHINPNIFKVHKLIPKIPKISSEVKNLIDKSFENTYGFKNLGKIYLNGLCEVPRFLNRYRYDPLGIKLLGYKIIDKATSSSFSWLSYKRDYPGYEKYLNKENSSWKNPIKQDLISNLSFEEMYQNALKEGAHVISAIEETIDSSSSLNDLKTIIPDKNSLDGLQ